MELWERIAKARTTAGMSQTQASLLLGVEQAELEAWERGEKEPSISQMTKICQVYNVSSAFLLSGDDPEGRLTEQHCTVCGTVLQPEAKFCPKCGRKVSASPVTVPLPVAQEQKTYIIVISTDAGHRDETDQAIRFFFYTEHDKNSQPSADCALADGRRMCDVTHEDISQVRDTMIEQVMGGSAVMLCRGVSYAKAMEILNQFQNKASVFVFREEPGITDEQLCRMEPVEKRVLGETRFSGQVPSWQPQPQQQVVIEQKNDGTIRTLAIIALVLLIIVLIFALL